MRLVKFVEVYSELLIADNINHKQYALREVAVNAGDVGMVRYNERLLQELEKGKMPPDLSEEQEFSSIFIVGSAGSWTKIDVIGDLDYVCKKLGSKL